MSWILWPFGHPQIKGFGKQGTLCLQRPFGKTIALTLIMLLLLGGIAEFITRLDTFQMLLREPAMGSRHYQLGRKLARLEADININGPIDCLIIGSSMVDVGFDPRAFRAEYKQANGQDIRCFNFGIDASTAVSAAAIAQILIEDYQPRFLIYGTDARDYAVPPEENDPAVILESNWVQYRLGNFSLDGWLIEHSYLYRYRYLLFRLSRFYLEDTLRSQSKDYEITADGFTPLTTVSTYINDPPDPQDDSFEVTYNFRLFSTYEMLAENLDALERIMDHNRQGTQVIVTEMPVADGLFYFFGNGQDDHQRFLAQVDQLAKAHEVPFWQTDALDMIPDDGWFDYSHVNAAGAAIFSNWLGQQVGEAVNQGTFELSTQMPPVVPAKD
jgi:hypothetical protein